MSRWLPGPGLAVDEHARGPLGREVMVAHGRFLGEQGGLRLGPTEPGQPESAS